ncbi:MAG: hypothetical protein V1676_05470 [Candidatus Diapherotrites archaeon]
MSDEEEDSGRGRRRKKGLLPNISSPQNIILIVIFIAGILAGWYLTSNFLDAAALHKASSDYNSLGEQYSALNTKADSYYACMNKLGIDAETCELPG